MYLECAGLIFVYLYCTIRPWTTSALFTTGNILFHAFKLNHIRELIPKTPAPIQKTPPQGFVVPEPSSVTKLDSVGPRLMGSGAGSLKRKRVEVCVSVALSTQLVFRSAFVAAF